MTHHQIRLPPRLGAIPRAVMAITIAGTVAAAWWGVMIGNVLRAGDLGRRSVHDFFSVDNGPASAGAFLGALLFLTLAHEMAVVRTGGAASQDPDLDPDELTTPPLDYI